MGSAPASGCSLYNDTESPSNKVTQGKAITQKTLGTYPKINNNNNNEDLAEELNEFFRFMIWNDLSGEEEEEESSFIGDEEIYFCYEPLR